MFVAHKKASTLTDATHINYTENKSYTTPFYIKVSRFIHDCDYVGSKEKQYGFIIHVCCYLRNMDSSTYINICVYTHIRFRLERALHLSPWDSDGSLLLWVALCLLLLVLLMVCRAELDVQKAKKKREEVERYSSSRARREERGVVVSRRFHERSVVNKKSFCPNNTYIYIHYRFIKCISPVWI